ncbi:MAG: DUF349 domain-containing protein [Bacteroidaceae bacterium]|nr:DUF349 domain-containing protein [Bacteroidaceae bacterium]
MDTLEQNVQNEATVEVTATEATEPAATVEIAEEPQIPLMTTKEEVLARAEAIAAAGDGGNKQELDLLKQLYYKYSKAETAAALQAHIDAGNEAETFVPMPDPSEEAFKQTMQNIRQRRAEIMAQQEQERNDNLQKKLAVIEKIKVLATTPEEAGKSYDDFKALQTEWREIGNVPAENVAEVWKNYQLYVEQFYDMLKLNIQSREYDFRKNLEAKIILCEQAEKLSEENDVVAALNLLQGLHQQWKEIGPVAKELRDDIWNRFKEASTVIRKRHQDFFESRKAQEEENLVKKTALCEKVEAIGTEGLKSFADWDAKTQEIIALQTEWKTIGYASPKHNTQIFERFREACDRFFTLKADYFKQVKDELNENLRKKTALAEQAEALKDSTDWRKTTDAIIELQRQWKTIGSVPRKVSDALWQRFTTACDAFFAAKSEAHKGIREEELDNLTKKRSIIDQLKALAEQTVDDAGKKVKELQAQWNEVGHVPMRDKDKIYKQYRAICDQLYDDLHIHQAKRNLESFRTSLKVTADKQGNALQQERQRLMRAYEVMKNEIMTYENNIGFLSASSKSGNALVAEISRKVEKLKQELDLIAQKIKAVNEEMK